VVSTSDEDLLMQPKLFQLEAIFEEFEHVDGMHVLGSSDARTLSVGELERMTGMSLETNSVRLGYTDSKGDKDLRHAVASIYPGRSADEVLITSGATEAIFLALRSLIAKDDVVLACRPAFQSLTEMARQAGARVRPYEYVDGHSLRQDVVEQIRHAVGGAERPRVLILNSPHNPTGQMFSNGELDEIMELAVDTGVSVLADEVFCGIWLRDQLIAGSAATKDPGVTAIGSLSKVYGMGGLRLGWLVGPSDLIRKCREWRYYTTNCPPVLVQQIGLFAITHREAILERNQAIARLNLAYVLNWLDRHRDIFDWHRPQAGLVMLIRLKSQVNTAAFARDLAITAKLLLIPCTTCFEMPKGYIRLGLGSEPEYFHEGLDKLDRYLSDGRWQSLPSDQ
jgi:aspartate/methionine/tyrosine aminotransferase